MTKCEAHKVKMIKDKYETNDWLCYECNGITKEALKEALGVE